MKKAGIFMVLALLGTAVFSAPTTASFSRAIAYYLIGDLELARKNLDAHFNIRPQPTIKLGFILLLQNDKWESTKKFRDYLESDHRSLEALIGISLATADVKNSLAVDNISKILRMNPGFAPAYLCLGNEYLLRNNFPAAEENFNRSLKYADIPEFKILLAELYLKTAQAQKALDLMRPLTQAAPGNYYFAFMTARACLLLDDCQEMNTYLNQALNLKPDSLEAQLLKGQYLLKIGELRKAKALLGKLKFNYYNLEYSLTFAKVLVRLDDRDAEKYLYEVFSQNQWHPGINKLMGLFHQKKKNGNVQNWIHRAILSGQDPQEMQKEFPAGFDFPAYPFFPIFEVKKIQWLGSKRILVAGTLGSGEKEKLLVLDSGSLKTIKSFEYEGTIQEIFPSAKQDKIVFSTTAAENEKVYIYTLIASADVFTLKPVVGYALKMPTILAAFNDSGTVAYFTDGSLSELAFISPFSTVSAYGRKMGVYPNYPFPVYSYTYANDRWTEIKNRELLRGVPLLPLQRYLLVADAVQNNPDVAKLLEKGKNIDITSSEEMKIHFSGSPSHFLLYFSDLKKAFQARVYDGSSNKLIGFEEAMFLGEKYYAELDIQAFHPEKNEILVSSRDKERNLVLFNYRSLLYKKLGSGLLAAQVTPDRNTIYMLSERNKYFYFSESNLEIIRLSPYDRKKINSRRDLNAIISCSGQNGAYFSTYNGELLKLDDAGNFSNPQVSMAGAIHQPSPDNSKVAAFINGRFYVLNWFD
jgi:tetratricopeptide (TPR) repeat protein